jgi:hypothetical protein
MRENKWVRLLAHITGLVNQELLLQGEYLVAENRILRAVRRQVDRNVINGPSLLIGA